MVASWVCTAAATPPPAGTAPVVAPAGGLAIDGDLMANAPSANTGDWLPGANGSGASVLDALGVPLNPTTTFHFVDPYNSGNDNVFVGGLKWTDDPNTWHWTTSKDGSKTDINNVLLHIAADANGHTWIAIAADRLSTSGDSYIDFEFLQNSLVCSNNGSFISAGSNGGRTTNDLLLSLAFTGGGKVADFFAWRWLPDGAGGFAYTNATAALPLGRVFVAANSKTVAVPYGAFGKTTYDPNAFAEAAVDLTELLGNFDPCLSIGFATIMVKTKTSQSTSATISDFINPIQYSLRLGPSADAGPDQTRCIEGASTTFPLQGKATPGREPIASTTWSVVSGSATIDSPSSLTTAAHVSSTTATLRLTVLQVNGCPESDDIVLTVAPLPTCSISGPATVCPLANSQFRGPSGMAAYAWSLSGDGSIVGATNAQTVTIAAGAACGANFTLQLNVASNSCVSFCTTDVMVNDTVAPTITSIPADITVQCAGAVPAPTDAAVVATDDCSGALVISHSDQMIAGACVNKFVIKRTYTATDLCGNSSSQTQTITVNDDTGPVITSIPADVTVPCAGAVPAANDAAVAATDNCGGAVVIAHSDQTTPGTCLNKFVIKRTYTATDLCGNTSSKTQTITVNDDTGPAITSIPADVTVECAGAVPAPNDAAVQETDNCGGAVVVTHSDQTTPGACLNKFVIKRTYTATDLCGNSSSKTQTITVNDGTAPVITSIPADVTVQCASGVPAPNDAAVAATDNCGGAVVITHSDQTTPGTCLNQFVIKRTYTATDLCGNSASKTQTITVNDDTGPTITSIPADVTVECAGAVPAPNDAAVQAADACGGAVVITHSDQTTPGTCPNRLVIKRTYTATDLCGNSSSKTQTITVNDDTAPVITSIPADVTVQCAGAVPAPNDGAVQATDNCGGAVVITHSDQTISGTCLNKFVIKRTYTATDLCGNSASKTQTITVNDSTAPVITSIPADVTVQCAGAVPAPNDAAAQATDNCSGAVAITHSDQAIPGTCVNKFVIKRTYTATDLCGNSSSQTQTITVNDDSSPSMVVPADVTLECPGDIRTNITGTATAQDNCGVVTIRFSDAVTNFCGGTKIIARTWTAADECGNQTSRVQMITIRDSTPPSLKLPTNVVLECPGDTRTNVTGSATASDGCGSVTITFSDVVSNSCGLTRTVLRLWTATDQCGNTTNGWQTITVRDTTAPKLTCPNIAVQCPGDVPAPYGSLAALLAGGGTASDACSPALTFALISDSGLAGRCPGKVTRVYRVTDACGNSCDTTQTITVDDTIAPVVTCPTNITLECGSSLDPAVSGRATASDNCDTNVTVTFNDAVVPSQYNIKWYAADPDLGTGPYAPTYVKLAPGSLPCPGEALLTGRAIDPLRNAVAYGPTSGQLDALTSMGGAPMCFGQIVPFEAVIEVGGGPGPERGTIEFTANWSTYTTSNDRFGYDTNYMVYCEFVDAADPGLIDPNFNARVASYSSKVINPGTIDERIRGTFRVSGLDSGDRVVVEIWVVLSSTTPRNFGGTIASDLVSAQTVASPPVPITIGNQTVSIGNLSKIAPLPAPQEQPPAPSLPPQPPMPPGGTVMLMNRTWTATDACGNNSTCVQQITVRDTTPPTLSVPADRVLEYPADASTNSAGVATAQDACGQAVVAYSDVVTNTCGNTTIVRRTWTAVDDWGNGTNAVQTITIQDTRPPTLTCPRDLVLEYPADTRTNATGAATAQDTGGAVTITYSDSSSNVCGNASVVRRLWTASDTCGNRTSAVQTITIQDTTPPTLTCPRDLVLEYPADTRTNVTGAATAQDLGGAVTIAYSDNSSNVCGRASVIRRLWTASDSCGNRTSAVQTITIQDTTPPTLTCPRSLVLEYPADTTTNAAGAATAQDTGGAVTIIYSDSISNICGNASVIRRLWTASDSCGNRSSAVQIITIQDTTSPALTPALVETVSADGYAGTGTATRPVAAQDPSTYVSDCPGGVTIGVYVPANGSAAPNGLIWEGTAGGLAAMRLALAATGPSGQLAQDATDPTNTVGGGELARQAVALTLNVNHNTSGSLGIAPNNFASLLYTNAGDALSGSTVQQLLEVANRALAGLGPPTGYNYTSLAALLNNVNLGFNGRVVSSWASAHLSAPMLLVQCAAQVPPPDPAQVIASDSCSSPVALTSLPDSITDWTSPNHYTLTRTWIAQDACGNTNRCAYVIQVNDTTPPVLTINSNRNVDASQAWTFDEPIAIDNCSTAAVRVVSTVTNQAAPGSMSVTRTWEATDASGNRSLCQQTIMVTNLVPPAISAQPRCQTVGCGQNTTLSLVATGTGPFTYQWRWNGANISGATDSSLALNLLQDTNAGLYTVVVSSAGGSVTSSVALVDVAPRLSMRLSGRALTLTWPGPFVLQSAPSPAGPYADVPGAASPYVQDTAASPQAFFRLRSGPFRVASTSLAGGQFSLSTPGVPGYNLVIQASTNLVDWVSLATNISPCTFVDTQAALYPRRFYRAVLAQAQGGTSKFVPTSISTQPLSQTVECGKSATLSVSAAGAAPLTYQWRRNGNNIAGATGSSLALNSLTIASAGLYTVAVAGPAGMVTSATAVINVAPALSSQLTGHVVTYTWAGPFILQWASSSAGPYTDVPGATSPYAYDTAAGPQKFFRLRPASFSLASTLRPGRSVAISTPGVPGYNLVVQASTDMVHWQNLVTNISPCALVDTAVSQYVRRFYRAVLAQ